MSNFSNNFARLSIKSSFNFSSSPSFLQRIASCLGIYSILPPSIKLDCISNCSASIYLPKLDLPIKSFGKKNFSVPIVKDCIFIGTYCSFIKDKDFIIFSASPKSQCDTSSSLLFVQKAKTCVLNSKALSVFLYSSSVLSSSLSSYLLISFVKSKNLFHFTSNQFSGRFTTLSFILNSIISLSLCLFLFQSKD